MAGKIRQYTSEAIDVSYDAKRCIHAAECVRNLAAVFDVSKRPWVQPANAEADAVAEVVMRCPTGALHFERKDGGAAEPAPDSNRILVTANGPLYVRGDVQIDVNGEMQGDTRLALCRCGQSANKPYCDDAHKAAGFSDNGRIAQSQAEDISLSGTLNVTPASNGPLLLRGNFELVSADGETVYRGEKAALCRCGGSGNKPFCDGTHKKIGFNTEASE